METFHDCSSGPGDREELGDHNTENPTEKHESVHRIIECLNDNK